MTRTRDERNAQVLEHDRLERSVGRDHHVSGGGAGKHRTTERQVRRTLQSGPRRIRRAELLEALRIQHQRRRRSTPGPSISEHTGAQSVHELNATGRHQIECSTTSP